MSTYRRPTLNQLLQMEYSVNVDRIFQISDSDLECKVYIGNLSAETNCIELFEAFLKYGPIRCLSVSHAPAGFAFISFRNRRDARQAVQHMHNSSFGGTTIYVHLYTGEAGDESPLAITDAENARSRSHTPNISSDIDSSSSCSTRISGSSRTSSTEIYLNFSNGFPSFDSPYYNYRIPYNYQPTTNTNSRRHPTRRNRHVRKIARNWHQRYKRKQTRRARNSNSRLYNRTFSTSSSCSPSTSHSARSSCSEDHNRNYQSGTRRFTKRYGYSRVKFRRRRSYSTSSGASTYSSLACSTSYGFSTYSQQVSYDNLRVRTRTTRASTRSCSRTRTTRASTRSRSRTRTTRASTRSRSRTRSRSHSNEPRTRGHRTRSSTTNNLSHTAKVGSSI